MSVIKPTTSLDKSVTVQTAADTKQLPKPASSSFSGQIESRKVEQLTTNLRAQEQAVESPKKTFDPASMMHVQNLLKETSRSTLDKLKSLLPIPDSLTPIIDMFLGKKTKANVKVSIENSSLKLAAGLDMPGQGIQGKAVLSLPMTAQPSKESVTELHPALVGLLSKALNPLVSEDNQVKQLIKLISTLPSKDLQFTWSDGSAKIIVHLPNGASLELNMAIPTAKESAQTPDILRTFLKSILKENYAGVETMLSQEMVFKWDGSTSRFDIEFPKQLALHIKEVSENDNKKGFFESLGSRTINAISENTTIIIPKNIRGTIDFKNSTIQIDKGTTFITMGIPDFTVEKISFNSKDNEINIEYEALWMTHTHKIKLAPKDEKNVDEKKINYEFISLDKNQTKAAQTKADVEKANLISKIKEKIAEQPLKTIQPKLKAEEASKPKVSVFENLKTMVKIPEALEPVLGIFLADQTKLDVNIGIEDNLTVSVNNLNIPKLGISGKASLSIPAQAQAEAETMPVKLHPKIDGELARFLAREFKSGSLEETALFTNLVDIALRMPNQNMHMIWANGIAQLTITLPGGMVLNLELNVQKIQGKNDPLMAQFLEVLDNAPEGESELYFIQSKCIDVFKTISTDDPRRTQIREVLRKHGNKDTLRAELAKVIERDIIRTKLTEIIGSQFAGDIEPLLAQTFNFQWNGETKEFSIKFLEEQNLTLKSIKLKKGGLFQNMLRKFVSWITKNRVITLPKEIHGKVNFETASVEFQKGTSFTIRTALGFSKRVGLRLFSFAKDHMTEIGFRCFGTQSIELDRRTSNIETARLAILENAPVTERIRRKGNRE
jgi:hypothetical protein